MQSILTTVDRDIKILFTRESFPVIFVIKMTMTMTRLYIATLLLLLLTACNRPPDVDHIDVNVEIQRFEQELFQLSLDELDRDIDSLAEKYSNFLPLYNHRIVNLGSHTNNAYSDYLRQFLTDYFIYQTYKKVQHQFPSLEWLENDLNKSFQYFRYYFPDKPVPAIYTFLGGFNQSIVTADSLIGIGLDKYLGEEEEFYLRVDPPIPKYQRYRMRPENIRPDCMQAWLVTEFPYHDSINNLINHIIYEGKITYAMERLMPSVHDTLLFSYTQDQLTFCERNEKEMWTYLIENKLLFENDKLLISKFIDEGPFTKDFSRESPGRAAVWLGREIVSAYLKKHKHISLADFMNDSDYQKVLNESGYNP